MEDFDYDSDYTSTSTTFEQNVKIRIPSSLIPIYKVLMKSVVGKSVMKRIKVYCGICKETKTYSIHRGVTKVASIIACENCRHFYQKLRRTPIILDCIASDKTSCYRNSTYVSSRCKACWAMQVLDYCPHPEDIYKEISNLLSDHCKKAIRGEPIDLEDVPEIGTVCIEILLHGNWIKADTSLPFLKEIEKPVEMQEPKKIIEVVPKRSEFAKKSTAAKRTIVSEIPKIELLGCPIEGDDPDDPDNVDDLESLVDLEAEDELVVEPATSSIRSTKAPQTDFASNITTISAEAFNNVDGEILEEILLDEEQESMDEEIAKFGKKSERIRRKKKKVQYYANAQASNASKKTTKGQIFGPDGAYLHNGKNVCDCLKEFCVGCHFPCPKCRSPKCGHECRNNRRWFYESVEVEGTGTSWTNKFAPKN